MGKATVTIGVDKVTITSATLDKPEVYTHLNARRGGHMSELITADGLSILYQDWCGCIHNAKITANFRGSLETGDGLIDSFEASQCTGGSTPDNIFTKQSS